MHRCTVNIIVQEAIRVIQAKSLSALGEQNQELTSVLERNVTEVAIRHLKDCYIKESAEVNETAFLGGSSASDGNE